VKIAINSKDPYTKKLHNPLIFILFCVIVRFFQLLKWGEVASPNLNWYQIGHSTQQALLTMWGSQCMNYH